jgi:hypothetical protein
MATRPSISWSLGQALQGRDRRGGVRETLLAYYANPITHLFALPALNRLAGAYAPASKVTRYTRAGLPDCRPPLWVNR